MTKEPCDHEFFKTRSFCQHCGESFDVQTLFEENQRLRAKLDSPLVVDLRELVEWRKEDGKNRTYSVHALWCAATKNEQAFFEERATTQAAVDALTKSLKEQK